MGFSLSWLACKDKAPESVRQELGCSGTGKFGLYGEFDLVGSALPRGWYLLVANQAEAALISDAVVTEVSSQCLAIACSIHEGVMYSRAASWQDGRESWRVEHFRQRGPTDLLITGEPPREIEGLRETAAGRRAARREGPLQVDYFFDVPLQLAQNLVGFKHDLVTSGIASDGFEVLSILEGGLLSKSGKPWRTR
jgi:hypothetical protein